VRREGGGGDYWVGVVQKGKTGVRLEGEGSGGAAGPQEREPAVSLVTHYRALPCSLGTAGAWSKLLILLITL